LIGAQLHENSKIIIQKHKENFNISLICSKKCSNFPVMTVDKGSLIERVKRLLNSISQTGRKPFKTA
jgi:hypothetical protein